MPVHQDENFGASPLCGPSQSYVYNEKTHNGVQQKILKKAGISIKKEEPELARKRNELRAIREQIMLKRASVGLTCSSFAIDDPELCSDDEETDRPTESNKRLQDERVALSLQDRVKQILLHRGCSKVIQTRRSPIRYPLMQDHPLKFRVQVALQKRFMDPPVKAPNSQIPMLAQEQDNQGFLRFLNILNKGVDIDKLRDIVHSATEKESRPAPSNSQRGKDTNGVEGQPEPKKTDQQNNLKYILKTLGLSLDPDDMSKMADRTEERLYCGKKSTEEEKGKTRDKKPARHSGRKGSKDGYSPGQYTRAGSATSSTSNRWSPAKSSSSSRRHKSPQRSSRSQRRYRSRSLSPRRYRSPSLSPRRYRSPSLSPRRYRRSRSPYRRSRYSRSRSRDSSGDSSIDSYRDSRSSYSPRSRDRRDPPRSYQSSTQPYPYPPPPLPPPPQQYYNPPYLPQMYPPPGQYATHSQYAAYNSYWGYSQTSLAWSNMPGQMPPPIMPPPNMPPPIMPPPIMPPFLPSPQTDPITSILGPPPESVESSKPDIFLNYNKKKSRCLVTIQQVETTDRNLKDKSQKKEWHKMRNAMLKEAVKKRKEEQKRRKEEVKRRTEANKERRKNAVPELNDDEVGEKPDQKLKLEALNHGKKPSTQSAATETKTELDCDEVEEKPSLTEEEVKANLKLKLEAFNSRMKKRATEPAAAKTNTELQPSLTEDEMKANLKEKLEGFADKRKEGSKQSKKSEEADNI
uniref:Uncharacterized protein n=1 Tax=Knipowitschia caucasica TaxID=637954 RepID=A0AAV2LPQ2_KNICA